jgi:AcrR family transcriptional regulator
VSREHREQRRSDILAAARRCFARSGFSATLQDVFTESGLSAGCVYSYFQSKHDLVLAIAEERHVVERLVLEAAAEEADSLEAIKVMMRRIFEAYLTEAAEETRRLALITWSEALFDEAVFASAREGMGRPRTVLTMLLKRGQTSGTVRKDVDPEAMAAAMVSMFQGLLLQKIWDPSISLRAIIQSCDQLLESLCA